MEKIRSHKDLIVWQNSMDFTVLVYQLTTKLSDKEKFGLSTQLTRAASSIPANIAEGSARGSSKEYAHFIAIARGSLMEVETFLLLSIRLNYFEESELIEIVSLLNEIDKMLTVLRGKLLMSSS